MSRTLGRSFHALGRQHIIALASVLALAACAGEPPANPAANAQYLNGETGDGEDTDRLPDTAASAAGMYSRYIALGDSFASGYGLLGTDSRTCAQSPRAWPPQLYELLGIAEPFTFGACSGATTQDILADGPLVVKHKQAEPQIALVQRADELDSATLITIQIGGNDLKLDDRIQQCFTALQGVSTSGLTQSITALGLLSPACAGLDELANSPKDFVKKALQKNLDNTFRALREAAPNATIVAVGYPHLINATTCIGLLSLLVRPDYRKKINAVADQINNTIEQAANDAGIFSITTDVVTAFEGHEACSPLEMIGSLNSLHPNTLGHQLYARLIATELSPTP
jgi:lysophospholipase L1-like esterase